MKQKVSYKNETNIEHNFHIIIAKQHLRTTKKQGSEKFSVAGWLRYIQVLYLELSELQNIGTVKVFH